MSDTLDKAKLKFEVRSQKDPTDETRTIFVPAIVERADPMQLSKVVYNAITRGASRVSSPTPRSPSPRASATRYTRSSRRATPSRS